jgi:hypothetical protein
MMASHCKQHDGRGEKIKEVREGKCTNPNDNESGSRITTATLFAPDTIDSLTEPSIP